MADLKLLALTPEDLEIFSAHLQDAILTAGDIEYLPQQKRFACAVNRFDWHKAQEDNSYQRRKAILRFDRVLSLKTQNISPNAPGTILSLLSIQYEALENAPEAIITLIFSGNGALRLHTECVEAVMQDISAPWQSKNMPKHDDET